MMNKGLSMDDVRRFVAILGLVFLPMLFTAPALARSGAAEQDSTTEQTYIVVLKKAPLAEWHRQRVDQASYSPRTDSNRQAATKGGRVRLDAQSKEAQDYLRELDRDFEAFKAVAVDEMGREVQPGRRFRVALNGFSMRMTAAEAQRLSQLPEVRFVEAERNYRPQTDAGPQWLGAGDLWLGAGSLPQTQGEGIIIGIIDSGIDWDHNSFNESAGSFTHTNPLGSQKGLCSDSEVMCNKKLIGVYSFIEDNPDTADIDEHAKGKDDSGHGTHVASTAAGIALQVNNNGIPFQMSGVAPHANLISYKVCTDGDPNDPDDDTCPGTAILAAIDQAVTDGVDVINYSLGASNPGSPWNDSGALAYLSAFGAGVFVATSASNDGPADSTIGSPAQAPWITSVGNASHNRLFGSVLENLTGGDTTPPPDIFGASLTGTSGFRTIVHASDFGNALCGTGTEELGTACNDWSVWPDRKKQKPATRRRRRYDPGQHGRTG
jgi:subtilisin family serine protease